MENPIPKKGKLLKIGEEISSRFNIQKYIADLKPGRYVITPILWLGDGLPFKSDSGYPVDIK